LKGEHETQTQNLLVSAGLALLLAGATRASAEAVLD